MLFRSVHSGSQKLFLVLPCLVLCMSVTVVFNQEEQQPTEPLTVNHQQGHYYTHINPPQTNSWLPHVVACVMGALLLVVMKTNLDYSTALECVKKSNSDYGTELERSHREVQHLMDKLRNEEKDHHVAILAIQEEKYKNIVQTHNEG